MTWMERVNESNGLEWLKGRAFGSLPASGVLVPAGRSGSHCPPITLAAHAPFKRPFGAHNSAMGPATLAALPSLFLANILS